MSHIRHEDPSRRVRYLRNHSGKETSSPRNEFVTKYHRRNVRPSKPSPMISDRDVLMPIIGTSTVKECYDKFGNEETSIYLSTVLEVLHCNDSEVSVGQPEKLISQWRQDKPSDCCESQFSYRQESLLYKDDTHTREFSDNGILEENSSMDVSIEEAVEDLENERKDKIYGLKNKFGSLRKYYNTRRSFIVTVIGALVTFVVSIWICWKIFSAGNIQSPIPPTTTPGDVTKGEVLETETEIRSTTQNVLINANDIRWESEDFHPKTNLDIVASSIPIFAKKMEKVQENLLVTLVIPPEFVHHKWIMPRTVKVPHSGKVHELIVQQQMSADVIFSITQLLPNLKYLTFSVLPNQKCVAGELKGNKIDPLNNLVKLKFEGFARCDDNNTFLQILEGIHPVNLKYLVFKNVLVNNDAIFYLQHILVINRYSLVTLEFTGSSFEANIFERNFPILLQLRSFNFTGSRFLDNTSDKILNENVCRKMPKLESYTSSQGKLLQGYCA